MLVFDIEADGFLKEMTKVHCINILDTETKKELRFNDAPAGTPMADRRTGQLRDGIKLLEDAAEIGGHNIHEYDIPALQKIYPWFKPRGIIHDSRAYCRLVWSELKDRDFAALRKGRLPLAFQAAGLIGLHSLKAWGYRMGEHKGEFTGTWETFTDDMDNYCMQDVRVNVRLFELIFSKGYSQEALTLENRVSQIIARQNLYGFKLDIAAAEQLFVVLQKRRLELEDQLRAVIPPWYRPVFVKGTCVVTPKVTRKMKVKDDDGTLLYVSEYEKGCSHTKIELVAFNPSSRDMIADRLQKLYGWTPTEFTAKGKPVVDESALDGMDFPEAKLLKEYLMVDKRIGQLADGKQAWLKKVGPDGRIHGQVNSNGAVTGRMTHYDPNVAQVPAVGTPYGKECRALFVAPGKKKLVGCDAESLEGRCLAHYMAKWDGGAYGLSVVSGRKDDQTDPHSLTKKAIGLNERENAKTWFYAFIYGAQDYKLGTIVLYDMTEEQRTGFNGRYAAGPDRDGAIKRLGATSRARIAKNLPALAALDEAVKKATRERGQLTGLDGRKVSVRAAHASLNTLLQGAGALVMKMALVILDDSLQAEGMKPGVDYEFVANIHDEFQIEAKEELAEQIGRLAAESIRQAGDKFGFRCQLAGAYKVGNNWADTH